MRKGREKDKRQGWAQEEKRMRKGCRRIESFQFKKKKGKERKRKAKEEKRKETGRLEEISNCRHHCHACQHQAPKNNGRRLWGPLFDDWPHYSGTCLF